MLAPRILKSFRHSPISASLSGITSVEKGPRARSERVKSDTGSCLSTF